MPVEPLNPPSVPATHPDEPVLGSGNPLAAPREPVLDPAETETPEPTELPPARPERVILCQNSSMVHSFEYDKADQTLRVYFRGGQIYDYFFIPEDIAEEFKRVCEEPTESAGRWFAQNVRKTYEFQKIA